MKPRWPHILIPLGTGTLFGFFTDNATWVDSSQALTSVVAIVSAGLLVRLARGVPFTAIEVLTTEEARKLADALKRSIRSLRALLVACFLTLLCLVFVSDLIEFTTWLHSKGSLPFAAHFNYVAALVTAALTYIFVRAYAVVDGDIQIADIQANILLKKRGKDLSERFQKDVAGPAKKRFRQPEGYGQTLPGDK